MFHQIVTKARTHYQDTGHGEMYSSAIQYELL